MSLSPEVITNKIHSNINPLNSLPKPKPGDSKNDQIKCPSKPLDHADIIPFPPILFGLFIFLLIIRSNCIFYFVDFVGVFYFVQI